MIRYMSVETFAANETQMIGRDTAAWQASRKHGHSSTGEQSNRDGGKGLTAGVRGDLPVFGERPTFDKDREDGCDEGCQDHAKTDIYANPVGKSEAIL
jgi:hypothetical protein